MLKTLAILLVGILIGANLVYFAMTQGDRGEAAPPCDVPRSDVPRNDVPRSVPRASAPPPTAGPAEAAAPPPAYSGGALLVPVQGVAPAELADTFGDARSGERQHEALDILAPAGTPVLAVADGHIEKLFESKLGGLTLYQFDPEGRFAYYYAHLQAYAPGVMEKKAVRRGDVIGYVGATGNADPAAPHLHFAVFALGPERAWWKGTPINPYPLLAGR